MKTDKQKEDWENEIRQIAPWLPLERAHVKPTKAPEGYFEELHLKLLHNIAETSYPRQYKKRLMTFLTIAAGVLLVFTLGKYDWSENLEQDMEHKNAIFSLTEEEASLWLKEEATISEVDLQLYFEGLTMSEEN